MQKNLEKRKLQYNKTCKNKEERLEIYINMLYYILIKNNS